MNITKQELLESIEEIKGEVIDHIISIEYKDHRKEYFVQCQKEDQAYEKFTELVSENTIISKVWFHHGDLLSHVSCALSDAYFDLGVTTTIDHFFSHMDSDSTEDEVLKSITDINTYMRNLFYSTDYNSEKVIRERDDSYRHQYEELCEKNNLFEKLLESYPEYLEYYKNTYLVERKLASRLSCRDLYYAGCRTVLHIILDKVLAPWKENL